MINILPDAIKNTLMYTKLRFWIKTRMKKWKIKKWEKEGNPFPPPPVYKHQTLRNHADQYNLKIFVETGTLYGDTIAAMMDSFDHLFSIELSRKYYEISKKRFAGKDKVSIIHGDSGIEIEKVLEKIDLPALFWLDGHYSSGDTARGDKDTPILEELTHIFNTQQKGHVIIIDDAVSFGNDPGYPSFEELCNHIKRYRPDVIIEMENNIIRITPSLVHG